MIFKFIYKKSAFLWKALVCIFLILQRLRLLVEKKDNTNNKNAKQLIYEPAFC